MDFLRDINVVVAGLGSDGAATFIEHSPPLTFSQPGAMEVAVLWGTDGPVNIPESIGAVPSTIKTPDAGGTLFLLACFPPRSAGKMDMRKTQRIEGAMRTGGTPDMHQTQSVDFEVIISGKIDILLENGDRRTLTQGSCLVMGGVMHAWENNYDEPCIYAGFILGSK